MSRLSKKKVEELYKEYNDPKTSDTIKEINGSLLGWNFYNEIRLNIDHLHDPLFLEHVIRSYPGANKRRPFLSEYLEMLDGEQLSSLTKQLERGRKAIDAYEKAVDEEIKRRTQFKVVSADMFQEAQQRRGNKAHRKGEE